MHFTFTFTIYHLHLQDVTNGEKDEERKNGIGDGILLLTFSLSLCL